MTVPNVEVQNSPIELRHRSFCKYPCCMKATGKNKNKSNGKNIMCSNLDR